MASAQARNNGGSCCRPGCCARLPLACPAACAPLLAPLSNSRAGHVPVAAGGAANELPRAPKGLRDQAPGPASPAEPDELAGLAALVDKPILKVRTTSLSSWAAIIFCVNTVSRLLHRVQSMVDKPILKVPRGTGAAASVCWHAAALPGGAPARALVAKGRGGLHAHPRACRLLNWSLRYGTWTGSTSRQRRWTGFTSGFFCVHTFSCAGEGTAVGGAFVGSAHSTPAAARCTQRLCLVLAGAPCKPPPPS